MTVRIGIAAHKGACGNARVPEGRSVRVGVSVCFSSTRRRGLLLETAVWASLGFARGTANGPPAGRPAVPLDTGLRVRAADVERPAASDVGHDLAPRGTTAPLPGFRPVRSGAEFTGAGGGRRPAVSMVLRPTDVVAMLEGLVHVILRRTGPFLPSSPASRDGPAPTERKQVCALVRVILSVRVPTSPSARTGEVGTLFTNTRIEIT